MKYKIRRWFIYLGIGFNAKHFILDLSNEDVNFTEIAHCIEEQIYKYPLEAKA